MIVQCHPHLHRYYIDPHFECQKFVIYKNNIRHLAVIDSDERRFIRKHYINGDQVIETEHDYYDDLIIMDDTLYQIWINSNQWIEVIEKFEQTYIGNEIPGYLIHIES